MKSVEVYTDGACSGNPGKGGWCAILIYGETEKVISGGDPDTTNNRMEVIAAIEGLRALKVPCNVTLYSDSAYLVNAIEQKWLDSWRAHGWVTAGKQAVKNKDLWLSLSEQLNRHTVKFVKVKGHADNEYNNRCDAVARKEISKL